MKKYLYCSYAEQDERSGEKLRQFLTQAGCLSWSSQDLFPGAMVQKVIAEQMKRAQGFVFLVSSSLYDSDRCMKEYSAATILVQRNPNVLLFPISLRPVLLGEEAFPGLFPEKPLLSFSKGREEAWIAVVEKIRDSL